MINRKSSDIEDEIPKLERGLWQRVKTTSTWSGQQYFPRFVILNQEIKWVKFNEHIIIKSEFVDRDKIFGGSGNMENIFKDNIMSGGGNNRWANMRYLHTCPIRRMDLVGPDVCLLHGELVKFTGDVIGGTGIGVPIVVAATVRV
jgi:hypothetical protein